MNSDLFHDDKKLYTCPKLIEKMKGNFQRKFPDDYKKNIYLIDNFNYDCDDCNDYDDCDSESW